MLGIPPALFPSSWGSAGVSDLSLLHPILIPSFLVWISVPGISRLGWRWECGVWLSLTRLTSLGRGIHGLGGKTIPAAKPSHPKAFPRHSQGIPRAGWNSLCPGMGRGVPGLIPPRGPGQRLSEPSCSWNSVSREPRGRGCSRIFSRPFAWAPPGHFDHFKPLICPFSSP